MVVTQEKLQVAERQVLELLRQEFRETGEPVRPSDILHRDVVVVDGQEKRMPGTVLRRALQNLISAHRIEVTDGSRLRPVT